MAETIQSLDQLSALKPAAPEAPKYVQKIDKYGRAYATGKRKDAVARVWLKRGAGKIVVNDREIEVYFARPVLRMMIQQPLGVANRNGQYDVICRVSGGGTFGPGRRGAPRPVQGADLFRAGAARRAQAWRLPHPRLPRGRAQEVRQGEGAAFVPVLETLIGLYRMAAENGGETPPFCICGHELSVSVAPCIEAALLLPLPLAGAGGGGSRERRDGRRGQLPQRERALLPLWRGDCE